MSEAELAAILGLPIEERLRMVQLIWDSVAARPSDIPLRAAHRAVIDQRLSDLERDPDDVVTREQVLAEARLP